jgi:hypothetical protein
MKAMRTVSIGSHLSSITSCCPSGRGGSGNKSRASNVVSFAVFWLVPVSQEMIKTARNESRTKEIFLIVDLFYEL